MQMSLYGQERMGLSPIDSMFDVSLLNSVTVQLFAAVY